MKLLIDENLSPRLVALLALDWPDSAHVETLGMRGATDSEIWARARTDEFIIVSKDDDFRNRALVQGPPPKVVWIQAGNAPTSMIAEILSANLAALESFARDPVEALLVLRCESAPGSSDTL